MELHPEQRFEIARQRQAEKLARGLEAYRALSSQGEGAGAEPTSRQHWSHAIAVLVVVIAIVSALAGPATPALAGNTPAPDPPASQHYQAATPAALAAAEAAHQRALAERRSAAEAAEAARGAALNVMYERQRRGAEAAERTPQQDIQAAITGVGGGGYGLFYAD